MGIVLRAHPVRGESHIQRNAKGEVATTSPPFLQLNEPQGLHVIFKKAAPGTTFTSWSQHYFVAIGKHEQHVRKASQCSSQCCHRLLCKNH